MEPRCPSCEEGLGEEAPEGLDTYVKDTLHKLHEGRVVLVLCPHCGAVLGTVPWVRDPEQPS